MKRLFWRAWTAAVVLTALCSCAEEALEGNNRLRTETITADMPEDMGQPGTRTCIDLNSSDNGTTGLLWQSTDTIGVYGQQGTTCNAPFACQATTNQAQATFSGQVAEGDPSYRAYYPYSAQNNGVDIDHLRGCLPKEQPFDLVTGKLTGDYKYGAPVGNTKRFTFRHLFSMLRVSVNAEGTSLEGDCLDRIILSVKDSVGNPRSVCGSFTFSARDGAWGDLTETSDCIVMPWTSAPQLTSGKTYQGFITILPTVKTGDRITITVLTDKHKAEFTAPCLVDFVAENIYNIPLTLKGFNDNAEKFGYKETELPTITSLKFTVAGNEGKILDKKLQTTASSSKYSSQFVEVREETATISDDSIGLTIPYLYDHKLIPTFTVSEGAVVTANGKEIESGETVVDWAVTDSITVTAGGESRTYRVHIGNTGLPVVVIKQSSSGDFSKKYTGGLNIGNSNIGGTLLNQFVDFMIRGKDTDWVEDDEMTVYNADGTVDMPMTLCGVRLRGNSTQKLPKKPFAIKLTQKKAVLGMASHKRWCLMANWLDRSMIRNLVGFAAANATTKAWKNTAGAAEGITWNPSGKSVELVINGRHVGNYLICEQIKIGSKRLNINDNYEDLTADGKSNAYEDCGYLVEFDVMQDEKNKGVTSRGVTWQLKDDVLPDDYCNKIKTKMQAIEDAIKGGDFETYSQLIDIPSAIDQWLIWELALNREYTEPRSIYGYINGGNDKLHFGPVWDFDRGTFQNPEQAKAMGSSRVKPWNAFLSSASKISRRGGYKEDQQPCMWYPLLMDDAKFVEAVQKRWTILYPYLQQVVSEIERLGRENALSWKYDSEMWPGTASALDAGYPSGFSDFSGDENLTDYPSVIENLINCYNGRLQGLDALIRAGSFKVSETTL